MVKRYNYNVLAGKPGYLMNMNRKIYNALVDWKNSPDRKPLILKGARQVGKTYLLNHFAKQEYDDFIYLNFDETPELASFFEADLDPERILRELSLRFKKSILPGQTLLIFDEIQECPHALNSLKYFCEKKNEYHIAAAGSLLGVKLGQGFPVGKVNFLPLAPLCFFEFLEAMGEKPLCDLLENLTSVKPLTEAFHLQLVRLLKLYFIIGGMPEAIENYRTHNDFEKLRRVQKEILDAYVLDFTKHAPKSDVMKIMQIWSLIPSQLAKENKKFIFTAISKSARAAHYEESIQWLTDAGLIRKSFNISTPNLPMETYANKNIFKVFVHDTGLLGAMCRLDPIVILDGHALFKEFKGALTENFVAQELYSTYDEALYYWSSTGTAEVDFVLPYKRKIYPLEVKAGVSTKKKSLLVYGDKYPADTFHTGMLSRATLQNFAHDQRIINYPLYAVCLFPKLQPS